MHPYQRAAAYGLVRSERGVLLTQLSESTNAAGRWTLPGGIDVGESPLEALHREVWEESGQDIADAEVLDIHTQHWIGAPQRPARGLPRRPHRLHRHLPTTDGPGGARRGRVDGGGAVGRPHPHQPLPDHPVVRAPSRGLAAPPTPGPVLSLPFRG